MTFALTRSIIAPVPRPGMCGRIAPALVAMCSMMPIIAASASGSAEPGTSGAGISLDAANDHDSIGESLAVAQSDSETQQMKSASADPTGSNVQATETAPAALTSYDAAKRYATLSPKGLNIELPRALDSVDGEAGGLRSWLADYGIGYFGMNVTNAANNVLPASSRGLNGVQQYNGQKFTVSNTSFLGVTYDLSRFGIPDGQLFVASELTRGTWAPTALQKFGIGGATYYQTLFNRRVELQLGYLANTWEFVNTTVGGSLASSVFGPAGSIPIQGGMSNMVAPTPGVNVKFNLTDKWYARLGVQRSLDPDGVQTEVNDNPSSLRWSMPNAGALYIGELGYQRSATTDAVQEWIRAGGAYNTSRTKSYENPGTRVDHNDFYYLLADRQIWQKSPAGVAARGLYVGASVMYAPPYANAASQYYELRLYGKGIFDSRPYDLMSIVLTDTVWGSDAIELSSRQGNLVHRDSKAVTVSYSARFTRGIYGSIGVGYVNHPTSIAYKLNTGSALNVLANLSIFF